MSPINAKYIKGPFKPDFHGGYIFTADNFMFGEVRGWGALSYEKDSEKIQDANLQFMVDALNEKVARDAQKCAQACSQCEGGDHKKCSMKQCHCDQGTSPSEAARAAYERLARYVGPQSEHRKNEGPLADVVLKELAELKKEVEWLRFYERNVYACLGPADDDINTSIRKSYVEKVGIDKLPEQLRIRHLEYEDDHKKET